MPRFILPCSILSMIYQTYCFTFTNEKKDGNLFPFSEKDDSGQRMRKTGMFPLPELKVGLTHCEERRKRASQFIEE